MAGCSAVCVPVLRMPRNSAAPLLKPATTRAGAVIPWRKGSFFAMGVDEPGR